MSRRTAKVLPIEPEARPTPARHGSLGKTTLLPWEDAAEFEALLAELLEEHRPQGPTKRHLVEELASVLWRSRRVRLAEAAAYRAGLHDAVGSFRGERTVERALAHVEGASAEDAAVAVQATSESSAADLREVDADRAMTEAALRRLREGGEEAYRQALEALREDTREWWAQALGDDEGDSEDTPYAADADGLRRFLEGAVMGHHHDRRREIERRPLIVSQAHGEAFDPVRLATLGRYETHLDRKLEKTLAMLLKLKEMRSGS